MAARFQAEISATSRICEISMRNTAGFFNEHSGVKKYLCSQESIAHTAKYNAFQDNFDIDVLEVASYYTRAQVFAAGKAELLQNIDTIDQCCRELESIVQMLNRYLQDKLTELRTLKAALVIDIEESIREVEKTWTLQKSRVRGKFSAILRSHEPGSLVLFRYQLNPNSSCLSSLLTFTLSDPGPRLLRFNKTEKGKSAEMEAFDFQTLTWSTPIPLSAAFNFNACSMYTYVDMYRVFCCGHRPSSTMSITQADYLIHLSSGQVEELAPLNVERRAPGVLHHEGELFVFGRKFHAGCNG